MAMNSPKCVCVCVCVACIKCTDYFFLQYICCHIQPLQSLIAVSCTYYDLFLDEISLTLTDLLLPGFNI